MKEILHKYYRPRIQTWQKADQTEKTKLAETSKDKTTSEQEEPQPEQTATTDIDPEMPPLEDIRPRKKFRFKDPVSKHFSK